jgi:hypothetical protein
MPIALKRRSGEIVAHTLVDDEDYETLNQDHWYLGGRGYVVRQVYMGRKDSKEVRRGELMHRRICGLSKGDGLQVDHINRDKLDNRRENLRVVGGSAANSQNVPGGYGKSGIRGVHWIEAHKCWAARVVLDGRMHWGGHFTDIREAEAAVQEMRVRLHQYATD